MATYVYWESIKKHWKKVAGGASVPVAVAIFLSLSGQSIDITGFSFDSECRGTPNDPCTAIINFTAKEDIFLSKTNYDPWGRNVSLAAFDRPVKSWKMYRKWGSGWREIPMNKGCTGTWCGMSPDDTRKRAQFAYAFREGNNYTVKLEFIKKDKFSDVTLDFGSLSHTFKQRFFKETLGQKEITHHAVKEFAGRQYTPECFSCHFLLNVSYVNGPGKAPLTMGQLVNAYLRKKSPTDDLNFTGIDRAYNETYTVTKTRLNNSLDYTNWYDVKEENTTHLRLYQNSNNFSLANKSNYYNFSVSENYTTTNMTENYEVQRWRWSWKSLENSFKLREGESVVLDFTGKRTPSLGRKSVDMVPFLKSGGNRINLTRYAWWNSTFNERYPHQPNGSSYTGIGYFGTNQTGWYGTINNSGSSGQLYTYNDTSTGDLRVANDTTEYCWFDTANNKSNCPKLTGAAKELEFYYAFDTTTGSLKEYINGRHGNVNGATRGKTGKVNNAFKFASPDDIKSSGHTMFSDSTWTIAVWFKSTKSDDLETIFETYDGSFPQITMRVSDAVRNYDGLARVKDAEGDKVKLKGLHNTDNGTWQHMTLTRNGDTATLYQNGVEVVNGTNSAVDNNLETDFCMGERCDGDNDFAGFIDDTRIYNRTLTAQEVENLYNSTNQHTPYLGATENKNSAPNNPTNEKFNASSINIGESILFNLTATDPDGDEVDTVLATFNTPGEWDIRTSTFEKSKSFSWAPDDVHFSSAGDKMFLANGTGGEINRFDLTTPWDIGSITKDQTLSVPTPLGIYFKPDGTELYTVWDGAGGFIEQYSLSTAWDLSTATDQNADFNVQDDSPRDVFFQDDGSKMYELGIFGDMVYQYSCSTAWNLSTCSYNNNNLSLSEGGARGFYFQDHGKRLLITDNGGDDIVEYTLSTAWDITTASSTGDTLNTQGGQPSGLFVNKTGEKLYETDITANAVYQSDLTTRVNTNYTLSRVASTDTYEVTFSDTLTTGTYNVTDTYVNDTNGATTHETYNALSFDVTSVGAASLKVEFQPVNTNSFVWHENDTGGRCGPSLSSIWVEPKNQTNSVGIFNVTNNGTISGNVNLKLSASANTGWDIMSNSTTDGIKTITTSDTTVISSLSAGTSQDLWMLANCTNVNANPGVSLDFSIQ